MKTVVILGSTGSIGGQALDVCVTYPEEFRVIGIAASSNVDKVIEQIHSVHPRYVTMVDQAAADRLRTVLSNTDIRVFSGPSGLCDLVEVPEADTVVIGIPGASGILPTLHAIRAGKQIIDANKESVAVAGDIILDEAKRQGVSFLPLDGEHLAIHQCLEGVSREAVGRLILTASGGAFRDLKTRDELARVTRHQAMQHPTWRMGAKITIECATLMNKGFEIIVAHRLFGIPYDRIDVVVHRESIVHSMVEMIDGSILAQLSDNDMRLSALYALSYPRRLPNRYRALDLVKVGRLTFEEPREDLFPCLRLARQAGESGGIYPAVANAANEVAVEAFLRDQIGFYDIPRIIEEAMSKVIPVTQPALEEILKVDSKTRLLAHSYVSGLRDSR